MTLLELLLYMALSTSILTALVAAVFLLSDIEAQTTADIVWQYDANFISKKIMPELAASIVSPAIDTTSSNIVFVKEDQQFVIEEQNRALFLVTSSEQVQLTSPLNKISNCVAERSTTTLSFMCSRNGKEFKITSYLYE